MAESPHHKRAIRKAFDAAATTYDEAARVQREICERLAAFASSHERPVSPEIVVDAGCGTGFGLSFVADLCPGAALVAVDFAPSMLARLASRSLADTPAPLCADLEALPLRDASVDAIWSSLALQWCAPRLALREFARTLKAGGVAWIATLGPRTLWELRDAFAAVDDAEHVIRFHAAEAWLAVARGAGFDVLAHENRPIHALAPDLRSLLRDIKSIGAQTLGAGRRRQPLGRRAWRLLEARYEAHRRGDGLLPATYDAILLALRKR